MSAPSKFYYSLFLNDYEGVDELPLENRVELLDEIGEYLKFTMLDFIGDKKSPVDGDKFENLSSKYAKKVGHKYSDLQFEGDMLDALDFKTKPRKYEIQIGFFDKDQSAKAFGHTTGMEGHPWLDGVTPKRKIIPIEGETFDDEIMDGIGTLIQDYIDANKD
jgi:hypothetical protein